MAISRIGSCGTSIINSIICISRRNELHLSVRFMSQLINPTLFATSNYFVMIVQQQSMSTQAHKSLTEQKYNDVIDVNNQTVEINRDERIRRSTFYKNTDIWSYYKSIHPNIHTLADVLDHGQTVSNDGPCLGFLQLKNQSEPIRWLSYSMVKKQASSLGSYLWTEKRLNPTKSKVAIISVNRPEYPIVEYGCLMYGFVFVNLFTSYDANTILNLLQKIEVDVLVVDTLARIQSFEQQLQKNDQIKEIIVLDDVKSDENGKIRSLSSVLKVMDKIEIRPRPKIDPSDLAFFLLTSGTTGDPKIAMLTHDNFVAGLKSTIDHDKRDGIASTPADRHCSFLPMAHLYEQAVISLMLTYGCRIVCCPTPDKLLDYYALIKPTRIFMVPRILNKVYDKVMSEVHKSKIKRFLVEQALRKRESSFLSRIIFRKVKNLFGGEVKTMLSASAPISRDVLHFFRIGLDIPIYEIFGQTESTGVNTATHIIDTSCGTVGTTVCSVEIKLIDVSGTNYRSENNQGEVCVRGPIVFKGYYNDEAKTREVIDEGGWLHTGDVGEWTPNGTLRLIDRCKHIFKLSQGQYIAPERLEDIYLRSRWISQIFVDGCSTEATVVAIVVPDEEYVRQNLSSATSQTFEELCKNNELKQFIMNDLVRLAKENNLKYSETVNNIYIHHEPFSQQNGLITSTLKTRRVAARKRFQSIVNSLYHSEQKPNNNKN